VPSAAARIVRAVRDWSDFAAVVGAATRLTG